MATSSQSEVTYTYKIVNLAAWAERPEVQQAFRTSERLSTEHRRQPRLLGLQLTSKGWEVPELISFDESISGAIQVSGVSARPLMCESL